MTSNNADAAASGSTAGPDNRGPDRPGRDDPGRGRRIGIDVGSVRIGIAVSDPDGVLATPVETVARNPARGRQTISSDVDRVLAIIAEYDAVEVVVGLPRTLRGERGAAVTAATGFAKLLRRRLGPIPVRMADERLTTVSAARSLRESGIKAKAQRSVIDQAAAVAILQGWLDERTLSTRTEPEDIA